MSCHGGLYEVQPLTFLNLQYTRFGPWCLLSSSASTTAGHIYLPNLSAEYVYLYDWNMSAGISDDRMYVQRSLILIVMGFCTCEMLNFIHHFVFRRACTFR